MYVCSMDICLSFKVMSIFLLNKCNPKSALHKMKALIHDLKRFHMQYNIHYDNRRE